MQESVEIDPSTLIREPSMGLKVYVWFLLFVCLVTTIKLIRIWRGAAPFRLSRQRNHAAYLQVLRTSCKSLAQWIGCTFLGWGILASHTLYNLCRGMLNEKVTGRLVILFAVEDFATSLTMALWVVSFAYLARWHMITRIRRLESWRCEGEQASVQN